MGWVIIVTLCRKGDGGSLHRWGRPFVVLADGPGPVWVISSAAIDFIIAHAVGGHIL
jgi:hypothetical protein